MKIRIDKRDTVFSKLIRLRARYNCEKCGRYFPFGHGLQCAHIFSRRHQSTRHDPDNAIALCFTDHQYFGEHPTLFAAWVKNHLGEVRYAELEKRHAKVLKRTKADSEALYAHLKEQFATLEADPNHQVVGYD
jgi:5-methylcytosine-specific restriction endonuclease McrA